ncbi:MAG: hypothetical protein QM831_43510 [Kofleriaceae bacterium]
MSKLETISEEALLSTHGGKQTWRELSTFANQHGYTVTSSTGGHHLGWAHKAGRAVDVRTRGHSASDIRSFISDARKHGITVIDERGGGNAAWTGPHLHLQK